MNSFKTETHDLVHAHWRHRESISSHPSDAMTPRILSGKVAKWVLVVFRSFRSERIEIEAIRFDMFKLINNYIHILYYST